MSDIIIKCELCGKQITVSEFVDPESLKCNGCGAQLKKPKAIVSKSAPAALHIKHAEKEEQPEEQEEQGEKKKKKKTAATQKRC